MNRQPMLLAAALAVAALLVGGDRASSDSPDGVDAFMRAKLKHSQQVLEGLTTEDYEMIAKNAGQMEVLSQEAAWQVLQTPEYRQQSLEFRRSTRALKEAAQKKNLDAAALAYVDVTMKCVRCHQYVRKVQAADARDALEQLLRDQSVQRAAE